MREQSLRNRTKERAKLALRTGLLHVGVEVQRDPWTRRVARMAASHRVDTVLDVGANVGQFGSLLRHAGFGGRILSLEPLPGAFDQLTARAARDPLWECLNTAVGMDGAAEINVSANSYSSSMLPMTDTHLRADPASRYIGTTTVDVVSVHTLVADHGVDPARSLLKIDTQGSEGEVLDSAKELLQDFAAIQIELSLVELYDGQVLMPELVARLDEAGLELFAVAPGFSGATGQMLQMDALFVREPSRAAISR